MSLYSAVIFSAWSLLPTVGLSLGWLDRVGLGPCWLDRVGLGPSLVRFMLGNGPLLVFT